MGSSVIRNFIAKGLFKKKGAIASSKAVDFSANILEQRLKNFGIDPNAITSENELNQILSAVKQAEDAAFSQQFGNMLGGSKFDKQADILDMTGKKIDPRSKIMGGKQAETEAEIAARINRENKRGIEGIKKRQLTEDEYQDFLDEVGGADQLEAYNFDGTVGDAKRIVKEQKDYMSQMELEYKKGNLDPGPGEANRKRFLQNKFDEMEASGDNRLMTRDEVEELSSFDLQRDMDKAVEKSRKKDIKEKKIIKDFDPGDRDPSATGGRIGYADGTPDKKGILDMLDVQASGSKTGKNQIDGAPDGITIDSESINAIIKADIPISQKIDLIAEYKYGKGRNRIEDKGKEIFMDEGGYKDRDIGFGFNQGGEGISGSVIRDLRTGDDDFKIRFSKKFAKGGRIGLAGGMTKRAFLKLMGSVGLGIGAVKSGILGIGKGATKQVAKEIVTTPAAAGKPAWFDALVTRVINEGEDVTKKFAIKDRQVVHATKVDDDAMVTVYRDLDDGTVRVDIDDATTNVLDDQGGARVSMEVRGGQLEEGVKGKTPAEFEATEADYRNYMDGPDDYSTEVVDNVVGDTKDLTADLTKVKMYAKGQKKPTIKEMMIQKGRAKILTKAEENPAQYAADRGPDGPDFPEPDDYASGGIARMLGE